MITETTHRNPSPEMTPASLILPSEGESIKAARDFTVAKCRAMGLSSDAVMVAALAASELVTNAYKHARSSDRDVIGVRVFMADAGPVIEVTDQSEDMPKVEPLDLLSESGRGLAMMGDLVHSWGVNHLANPGSRGKVVWALLYK